MQCTMYQCMCGNHYPTENVVRKYFIVIYLKTELRMTFKSSFSENYCHHHKKISLILPWQLTKPISTIAEIIITEKTDFTLSAFYFGHCYQ